MDRPPRWLHKAFLCAAFIVAAAQTVRLHVANHHGAAAVAGESRSPNTNRSPHRSGDRYRLHGQDRYGAGDRYSQFTDRLRHREQLRKYQLAWQNKHRRGYGWAPNYRGYHTMDRGYLGNYTPWDGIGFGVDVSYWERDFERKQAVQVNH